ncbi:hypothetical protein DFJ73DRAFT_762589 [Zopfochytrium polystomum]|nr:hypothetical protein DFJ73DRAFT_762589 [Zopfochytrium polystomum]
MASESEDVPVTGLIYPATRSPHFNAVVASEPSSQQQQTEVVAGGQKRRPIDLPPLPADPVATAAAATVGATTTTTTTTNTTTTTTVPATNTAARSTMATPQDLANQLAPAGWPVGPSIRDKMEDADEDGEDGYTSDESFVSSRRSAEPPQEEAEEKEKTPVEAAPATTPGVVTVVAQRGESPLPASATGPATTAPTSKASQPSSGGGAGGKAATAISTSSSSAQTRHRGSQVQTPNTPTSSAGILSSIVNAFQAIIDPELTEEELLGPPPEYSPTHITPPAVYNPEDDFYEGKKFYDQRQWEKAVRLFETAAVQCDHVEAMKYLIECYHPSRLANATKVKEWTNRRMAVLGTPAGMLSHGLHLLHDAQVPSAPTSVVGMITGSDQNSAAKKVAEAIVLIRSAADLGYPPAMHEFAIYLRSKGKGSEAMAWFHRAVDAGHEASEEYLARGYESGIGVPADPVAGAHWRARVNARKKAQEEEEAKERERLAAQAKKQREEAQRRLKDRHRIEGDLKSREEELKVRRALDPALNSALRSIEWGFPQSGIEALHKLAVVHGNADARNFLNPDLSPISRSLKTAMFHLGQYHATHADFVSAVKWYRMAADEGYHEAQVTLAAYLIVGKGVEMADPGQAMVWLMKAWETGKNKEAALALGEAYTKGIGVMPDPNKAVKWYIRAWETGEYPEAAFAVGLAYATGFTPGAVDPSQWSAAGISGQAHVNKILLRHTEEKGAATSATPLATPSATPLAGSRSGSVDDLATNASSTTAAAAAAAAAAASAALDEDSVPSSVSRGSVMPSSPLSSAAAVRRSPRLGRSISTSSLGSEASSGSPGGTKRILKGMVAVKQDLALAVQWYRKAANLGHIRGCNNLGELYMTGRGLARNDVIGYSLFKRAAMSSLPEAEYNMGRCKKEGRGCEKDEEEALVWFRRAEAHGIAEATKAIASMVGKSDNRSQGSTTRKEDAGQPRAAV